LNHLTVPCFTLLIYSFPIFILHYSFVISPYLKETGIKSLVDYILILL